MNVSSSPSSSVQSTQKPTQLQKSEQNNVQNLRSEAQVSQSPPEPSKPVVNTQGQTTGRILNVTA